MNYPNPENINRWLFDWTEGNLSLEQESMLESFLDEHPEFIEDAEAWQATHLTFADVEPVDFTDLQVQEAETKKKRALAWWFAPASLLLLAILGYWSSGQFLNDKQTAEVKSSNKIEPNTKQSQSNKARATFVQTGKPQEISAIPANLYTESENNTPSNNESESFAFLNSELKTQSLSNTSLLFDPLKLDIKHIESISQNKTGLVSSEKDKSARAKQKTKFSWPNLKISKNKVLGSYLLNDVTANLNHERVYVFSEKSHLDVNQSMAGNMSQTRVQSTTFARWITNQDQKITQQIAIDAYVRKAKSGIAAIVNYTDFGKGIIQDWNVNLIYSPKIALGHYFSIEPSIGYQFGKKSLNSSKISNGSNFQFQTHQVQSFSYDVNLPIGEQLWYRDLSSGLMLNAGPIYFGGQVRNILRHQDNVHTNNYNEIDKAPTTYGFIAGTDFKALKGRFIASPMIYHERNVNYNETQIGGTIQLNNWVIGGNYSTKNQTTALFGYQSSRFSLLAQSTLNQSLNNDFSRFSNQLTLRINSNISRKTRRYLYL